MISLVYTSRLDNLNSTKSQAFNCKQQQLSGNNLPTAITATGSLICCRISKASGTTYILPSSYLISWMGWPSCKGIPCPKGFELSYAMLMNDSTHRVEIA